MDLIMGLSQSRGYDSILTIVDHGCLRAAIFLPCQKTITGPQIAQLYYKHLYPWFGLPKHLISDQDPQFTSHFDLSTAYHPQTDGLTERKNQWVEQFLHLVSTNQNDWSTMLPLATLVHNNMKNSTTGLTPNQSLNGLEPTVTPRSNNKLQQPHRSTKGQPIKAMEGPSNRSIE